MEKATRERLLDAGVALLGTVGARDATARAVETRANVPHGTLRHHFGDQSRYLSALADHVLSIDVPLEGESAQETVRRWLTQQRTITRARYELAIIGLRNPAVGRAMVTARDTYLDQLVRTGMERSAAAALIAAVDGLVLDALMRGEAEASLADLGRASTFLADVDGTA